MGDSVAGDRPQESPTERVARARARTQEARLALGEAEPGQDPRASPPGRTTFPAPARSRHDAVGPGRVRYGRISNAIVLVVVAVLVFLLAAVIGNAFNTNAAPPDVAARATGFVLVPLLGSLAGAWLVIRSHRRGRPVLVAASVATPLAFLMIGGVYEGMEMPLALSIAAALVLLLVILVQGSIIWWKGRRQDRKPTAGG